MPRPSPRKAKVPLGKPECLFEKAAPQMAASMGHFKLVGSPKQKSYRPRRRLQYQKETAESPSKSHRSFPITA